MLSSGSRVRAEETPPRIVHHPSDVVVKVGSPATLSCRADGNTKVTIEWLRNGQPLEMAKGGGLQPIALPEGSLFFLSVGDGKRGPSHEGVYACVARNSAGQATSRNASLYVAGEAAVEAYARVRSKVRSSHICVWHVEVPVPYHHRWPKVA